MRSVIIGSGAAGISAAMELAKRKPWEEIIIISKDDQPYSRCMLHYYLAGERNKEKLSFVSADIFEKKTIVFYPETTVQKVESENKKVITDKGEILFDKLLIATGVKYTIPPVPNFRNAVNVYGFRDFKDAVIIKKAAERSEKVVIVGAGLIGLDVAYALKKYGLNITIVEMASRIMPLQTDEVAAERYQDLFEKEGIHFHLGVGVCDSVMDNDGYIREVSLSDGTVISCDFVVVAAGVRPDTAFLDGSGIFVNRGVKVDEYMKTSCDSIYAAGDITGLSGIWPNAVEQGRIAAVNMSGGLEPYTDKFCLKNTCNYFGLYMLSVGNVTLGGEDCTIVTKETQSTYKKVILKENCVVGALMQGDITGAGIWQYLIKNHIDISEISKPIFHISIADFHCFDEDVRKKRTNSVIKVI